MHEVGTFELYPKDSLCYVMTIALICNEVFSLKLRLMEHFHRQSSITEDGVTTRFREEVREPSSRRDSLSRDSGISSIRENSILDTGRRDRDRDGSLSRLEGGRRDSESRFNNISMAETLAEMRNK